MSNISFEPVIGLEVHVELLTATKAFCSCPTEFGGSPNEHTCPVCLGMPGALPALNIRAVELAVKAGLALGCEIHRRSAFDRKNYFYPDLPKGYQITQYHEPICTGGGIGIRGSFGEKTVGLERIHIEEDAGKLIHRDGSTLIDFNRAGVPLIEIVSRPQISSPEEAMRYLEELRRILTYHGISDCRMNEGSMRCDVNVSLRETGSDTNGERCEIKNINSISYAGKAIEYEIERQKKIIESGGRVKRETLRFNEDTGETEHMRYKETEDDYRYFREPNIPELSLSSGFIDDIRRRMYVPPYEAAEELMAECGIPERSAELILFTPGIYPFYLETAALTGYRTQAANLLISEIIPKDRKPESVISAEDFAAVCDMFGSGEIVSSAAKTLIGLVSATGVKPRKLAKEHGLLKIRDESVIRGFAEKAIAGDPKSASDYRAGKVNAVKQLLGSVMRMTGGAADPILTEKELRKMLDRDK